MAEELIVLTDAAREKIISIQKAHNRTDSAVRVIAEQDGLAAYKYDLRLVNQTEKSDEDKVVDAGGLMLYVHKESVPKIQGAKLDFVAGASGSGFKFDNPNKPPAASDPFIARVQKVIDERINPQLAGHGGHVSLFDVEGGKVYIQMGGGCQGCGMADVTLKQGIEAALKEEIPEIEEVLDSTDHASGTNPYYQPGK